MAVKPLILGGYFFPSKEFARRWTKDLLNSVKPKCGERIELPGNLFAIIRDILGMHPRIHEKIPNFPDGVEKIIIRKMGNGNQYCYVLPGSYPEAFSYTKCLDSQSAYHKRTVNDSFRTIIRDQMEEFKRSKIAPDGYGKCELSGGRFLSKDLVVDHYVPFSHLLNSFMKENKLKYEDIKIDYDAPNFYEHKPLADKQITEKFIEYHRKNAVLCLIHKELNARLRDMVKQGDAFKFAVDAFRRDFGCYV